MAGHQNRCDLHDRAAATANVLWPVLLGIAVVFLVATAVFTPLYANYLTYPVLFLVPLAAVAALLGVKFFLMKKAYFKAWFSSAATIVFCTFFGVVGLFPNLYPSSIDPALSLTAFNASSSPLTLKIMLMVVILFIPIVVAYQVWSYTMFSKKMTEEDLSLDEAY